MDCVELFTFFSHRLMNKLQTVVLSIVKSKDKSKAIPVTGLGGL
jgi:hypothetical protein